jgi:hypothetical protein
MASGNPESFNTVEGIRRAFAAPLAHVTSAHAWFAYLNTTVIPLLYPVTWYDGAPISEGDLGWPGSRQPGALRLMGSVAIRQVCSPRGPCNHAGRLLAHVFSQPLVMRALETLDA